MTNNQNQRKVYLVIIAILLIANIAILAFFLQKKDSPKAARADMRTLISGFLKNDVGFDQHQLVQFDTLSKLRREKIRSLYENARNKKTEQFKQLAAGKFSDSVIKVIAEQSAESQKAMDIYMFNHIKSIRTLCTPGQVPKFDSLFINVFNRKGEGRKKQQNKN